MARTKREDKITEKLKQLVEDKQNQPIETNEENKPIEIKRKKKITPETNQPQLPKYSLKLINNKLVIEENNEVNVRVIMSEGLTYTDRNGNTKQIPEITITLSKNMDNPTVSDNIYRKPISRSFNSVLQDNLKRTIKYPESIRIAIRYLEKNFERSAQYFGFQLDMKALSDTRLAELFDRASSGARILTTVCEM